MGRNFRHDPKIGVRSTSLVGNDVLEKSVFPVSHDQRSPHDSLPLSLYFCRPHGIPLIVQNFPPWRLQPETLIAWKMLAAYKVSQIFVTTISQNWVFLTRNTAIKMAGSCRNICRPSLEKMTNINCPPRLLLLLCPFGQHSSPGLTHVTFNATFVASVTQSRNKTWRPLLHLLQLTQNIIWSCEEQICVRKTSHKWQDTPWGPRKKIAKLQKMRG